MSSATREEFRRACLLKNGALVRSLFACLMLLLCCVAASAQTPAPVSPSTADDPPLAGATPSNPCDTPPGKDKKDFNDYFKCLKHKYDRLTAKDGPHAVIGSVAPGGGTAGGIGFSKKHEVKAGQENWEWRFDSSARISFKKYWEVDSNLTLIKHSAELTDSPKFTKCNEYGPEGTVKMDFYGQLKDMPRVDYFGLGPESREQNRAVYHYREGVVGADISKPSSHVCWLDVGGAVEGIFPDVVPITNPTVRSVERVFNETGAPGITVQPGAFLHLAAYARLHSRKQPEARGVEYIFIYHAYQDLQEHRYSFRRFDMDLRNKFPIGASNEIRVRGRLSLSETRAGQRVPFYLMETLGGSNIRGDDTLRGFRDYRFRDRDYALLQTEYLRRLGDTPIHFIAFYDTGKVASSISSFGNGRLRHTYGLGIVVVPRQLDNILFRFYVALGSGEGSHTYFGGGSSGRGSRLIR